ncbi:MAG TPA: hypothetical protein VF618_15735 [Thermoanaerobaculia bacterium]
MRSALAVLALVAATTPLVAEEPAKILHRVLAPQEVIAGATRLMPSFTAAATEGTLLLESGDPVASCTSVTDWRERQLCVMRELGRNREAIAARLRADGLDSYVVVLARKVEPGIEAVLFLATPKGEVASFSASIDATSVISGFPVVASKSLGVKGLNQPAEGSLTVPLQ